MALLLQALLHCRTRDRIQWRPGERQITSNKRHRPDGPSAIPMQTAPITSEPMIDFFVAVRKQTVSLTETLEPEDAAIQTMPDVSPTKWHLAHTTWFFEEFVLKRFASGYRVFNERYDYLFNSYYFTVGEMHARPRRGDLSRPTLNEIRDYRCYVAEQMAGLLSERGDDPDICFLTTLGCHHEQQHQELILTDIKHVFGQHPLYPVLRDTPQAKEHGSTPMQFIERPGGVVEIGHNGSGFAFDNETPRHRVLIAPFALATRVVTNAEYRQFIGDGAYQESSLWLSDGWSVITEQGWNRPLYWTEDCESEFTLGGLREIQPTAPVTHISYYEADAFARWTGARLPTEAELETVIAEADVAGNFVESGLLHPSPAAGTNGSTQLYGDVWEWTTSSYSPYPGFKAVSGSLGEYNGKFMCNQMVLRGGSCATPESHIRPTYRNFFYPHQRWQFTGVRLAKDISGS